MRVASSSRGDATDPIVLTDSENKATKKTQSKKKSPKKRLVVIDPEVEVIEIDD